MTTKIYAFHKGCEHEGGATVSLHKSYETALAAAKAAAELHSKEMTDWANSPEIKRVYKTLDPNSYLVEKIEHGYKIRSDIYVVRELELQE